MEKKEKIEQLKKVIDQLDFPDRQEHTQISDKLKIKVIDKDGNVKQDIETPVNTSKL